MKELITRYHSPAITPLELGDLWVGNHILWYAMQEENFPTVLRGVVESLRRGEGATESDGPVPAIIKYFDSLYVAGGGSQEPGMRAALSALEFPVSFSRTPDYPGERGGLSLLAQTGAGWVCDLGQSSFKICATERMRFERDHQQLPIRTAQPVESIEGQRRALRDWLSGALRTFATQCAAPEAMLFALPSRVNDDAVPDATSYIGMGGDDTLIADIIAAAGLKPVAVLVMNDAELAALDALAEPELKYCEKTLVLTLGFGLGSALVKRRPPGRVYYGL